MPPLDKKLYSRFQAKLVGSVYILGLKWNLGQMDDDYEDLSQ